MRYSEIHFLNKTVNRNIENYSIEAEERIPNAEDLNGTEEYALAKYSILKDQLPTHIYICSDDEANGRVVVGVEVGNETYILDTLFDKPFTYSEGIRRGYNFYLKKEGETWYKLSQSICLVEDFD